MNFGSGVGVCVTAHNRCDFLFHLVGVGGSADLVDLSAHALVRASGIPISTRVASMSESDGLID